MSVFKKEGGDEKCPACGEYAFVDGTYGTPAVPGILYPAGYRLCLNCGYDEVPLGKKIKTKNGRRGHGLQTCFCGSD